MPRNYQSPIKVNWWVDTTATKVVDTIAESARDHFEDAVLHYIQKFDIHVDRNELVKALEYDRHQYDEGYCDGYQDGKRDAAGVVLCRECKWYYEKGAFCNYWADVCEHAEVYARITPTDYCSRGERKESEDEQQEETTQAENDSAE